MALYYLVQMQWTELVFMRKQQEVYDCLSIEEQLKLNQYCDLLQMVWYKTLHELHDRMTSKKQFGYTPENVFNDTSINNVVQDVIAELDQVDEQGRETMLAVWHKKKNRPYSSTSLKEIVENFYNKFQTLCGKWQKMQEKLPAQSTSVFELPGGESLFLRKRPVEKEMTPHRAKLFAQARHIFVTIHEMFLSAANRWPEYKDKEEAEALEPETSSKLRT